MNILSSDDQRALDALRRAVAAALVRKRQLGQYAVIWCDGLAVRLEPPEPLASAELAAPPDGNEVRAATF